MLDIILMVVFGNKLSGMFKAAGKTGAGKYIGGMVGSYVGGILLMYILMGIGGVMENDMSVVLILGSLLFWIAGIVCAIVIYQKGKKEAGPPQVSYYGAPVQAYQAQPYGTAPQAPVQQIPAQPAPAPVPVATAQPEAAPAMLHYGQSCGKCGSTSNQLAAANNWQWDGLGYCAQCDQYYCVNCQQEKGFGQCPTCAGQLTEK